MGSTADQKPERVSGTTELAPVASSPGGAKALVSSSLGGARREQLLLAAGHGRELEHRRGARAGSSQGARVVLACQGCCFPPATARARRP